MKIIKKIWEFFLSKEKKCSRCGAVFRNKYTLCEDCLLFLEGKKNKDPAGIAGDNDSYPFFKVRIVKE